MKLPSGATIPCLKPAEAERRGYLSQELLNLMHLAPVGDPVAYSEPAMPMPIPFTTMTPTA